MFYNPHTIFPFFPKWEKYSRTFLIRWKKKREKKDSHKIAKVLYPILIRSPVPTKVPTGILTHSFILNRRDFYLNKPAQYCQQFLKNSQSPCTLLYIKGKSYKQTCFTLSQKCTNFQSKTSNLTSSTQCWNKFSQKITLTFSSNKLKTKSHNITYVK